MRHALLPALPFSLLLSVGCLAEDASSTELDPELDDAQLAQTEAALCGAGTTPPAWDWYHNFGLHPDQLRSIADYGTTSCANYVVRLSYGGSPDYTHGSITISSTGALPTTPEACVGTSLTVRKWAAPPSGSTTWTVTSTTSNAEWTASGCVAPSPYWGSPGPNGARFEASSQRVYCPGSGPFCGQFYGLPIKIKVESY